ASGIDVTLVARSIDQSAITLPDAATSLTLLLDGPSFVRTHITVPPAATLVIDSLNGDDTADTLTIPSVAGTKNTYASIGGDGTNSGTITIRGGGLDITARSAGAAIGGGGSLSTTIPGSDAGTVAITGGVVTITQFCADGGDLGTGSCGAGIGGGGDPGLDVGVVATGDGGTIAITGGTVGITQYGNAAGIGAGAHGPVGDITIGGAAVTSTVLKKINQAGEGSAIGSSSGTGRGGRGTITITGGTVRATTTDVGAGIGSSNPGKPIHITISGGDVYAASPVGAGIGSMMGVLGDSIAITGGVVVASGGASPGIGNRVAQVAPDFCLSSAAQVTATSGKSPAFVVKANTCDGYYVNAELDKAPSSSAATTLDVHRGALTTSLTLPAASTHFGYGTNSDVPTNDLVVASNGTVTLGTVVRSKDSSTQLYSIHDPAGYAAHQTATGAQANAAVLPVRLTPFASGVVSVSDVGRTTATFHSTGQLSAGTFREGGFRYSTDAAVDAQGALTGAGVVKVPWSGFSASQITAPVVGLDEATTYYVQTYLSTSLGDLYSAVVAFTTRGATVLDLSATTADGAGYTVTGLTPGLDEYATRFPSSDGVVADPAGVVTFGTDGEYALVQSGVLAAPADVASPKNGTSIIGRLVVPDGVNLTLTLRGIDLTGDLVLVGTATVTLLLDADATFAPGATNTVRGSLVVPRDASGVASLVIDDAGGGAGVLTVTATGADAAGIGGDQTGASAGAITIQGGTVTAAGGSGGGAGIGGAAGGSGATLTIGAGAVVTAYATGSSRPALDADGGNHGTGFSANAMIDVPLPGPISVFRDGYAGGRVSDAIEVLALPAGYRAFAYTTGGTSRTDNLYADLGYAAALGRTDHRAIARSADDAKPVFSAQRLDAYDAVNPADAAGTGVLQLTLRRPPTAG
ncbi:MAG: hypothetical protein FWC46_00135, partial [Actinomycetia bacterium]|nr:hypothetical protein [Actinomycetes bacterium]